MLAILSIGMISTTVMATTQPPEQKKETIDFKVTNLTTSIDLVVTFNPAEDYFFMPSIEKPTVITAEPKLAESLTDQNICVDDVGWHRIRLCQSDFTNLHDSHQTPKILLIDPGSGSN